MVQMPGCKHRYHQGCVLKWFEIRMTCPLCNTKLRDALIDLLIIGEVFKGNRVADATQAVVVSGNTGPVREMANESYAELDPEATTEL